MWVVQLKAPLASSSHAVWQAVRASSAAPYYLDDFKCGSDRCAAPLKPLLMLHVNPLTTCIEQRSSDAESWKQLVRNAIHAWLGCVKMYLAPRHCSRLQDSEALPPCFMSWNRVETEMRSRISLHCVYPDYMLVHCLACLYVCLLDRKANLGHHLRRVVCAHFLHAWVLNRSPKAGKESSLGQRKA